VVASSSGTTAYVTLSGSDAVAVLTQSPTTLASGVAGLIPVGSRPADLALDPSGARLYVANNGADSVSVIDTATSTVVATVPVGSAPGDIAIDTTGAFAYVTNNGSGSVSVIDTTSGSVVATVPVGSQPWGIAVTGDGASAFVANYADGTASVIDLASRRVVATVRVGANPFGVATWSTAPADGSAVYVSNSGGSTVSTIQLSADTPAPTWTIRKRTRTVTGVVPFTPAVEFGIRAVQGNRVRTGTCVRTGPSSAPKAACTVRLPKGTWRVSVTTQLPWQPAAGGNQNRRVRF
jgi:YVTN family beta-propeller protein